jgi:hypothetical protein
MPFSGLLSGSLSTKSTYLGQVATRCRTPEAFFATNKQFQARSGHYARDDITSLKIVLPNFYITSFSNGNTYLETPSGGIATWTAAIEYPSGTMTQVKWGGATSVAVPNGWYSESDFVTVTIPRGALFQVRMFYSNPAGIIFNDKAATHFNGIGDQLTAAVSGLTDNTMSGAYGTDDTNNSVQPLAIIANTRQPSLALIGDSRVFGETETSDATGDVGEYARAVGPYLGYANYGVRGDGAVKFLASCTIRESLTRNYFSHFMCNYGINDIELYSRSAENVMSDRAAIQSLMGMPMLQSTILPHTDASNLLPNNQGFSLERVRLNQMIRGSGQPFVDSDFVVSNALNDTRWKAGYTTDGLHPNQVGCQAIQTSGIINTNIFNR